MQMKCLKYFLLAAVTAGCLGMTAQAAGEDVISDGVFIGDKDVSGMTEQEAQAYVDSQIEALGNSVITLKMGEDTVSKTWKDLGLKWENKDLVSEIGKIGTTGNIIRRYKEQKDLQNQSSKYDIEYSIDESLEKAFVESCASFNSVPVEGSVYMGEDGELHVSGGTDGLVLDADATLASLTDAISTWEIGDQTIEATVERTSPELTADLLGKMTDVLGTATTDYSASSATRAQNVENGTYKIDGTFLRSGESFSVTSAVVPFSAENGYGLAPSYESGQVVDSYGGGICQVSTTLYNAVLKAELEVDARSNHTMLVTYVDPSKDAAIAEGLMDFVFTNTSEYPIYISGSAYYGTLNFTIYGVETRPANRSIEFISETLSQTNPDTNVKLVAKTDQAVGYFVQTQSPHQGLTACLWKNIYYDGVLSDTIQVNSSYYDASPAIYEVGVLTDNPALSSAIYQAIGSNSVNQVYSVINGAWQQQQQQTEPPAPTPEPTPEPEPQQPVVNLDEEMMADQGY